LGREHDLKKVTVPRLHKGSAADRLASHDVPVQRSPVHFGVDLLIEFDIGDAGSSARAQNLAWLGSAVDLLPSQVLGAQ
jgi:hypothetical protein